MAIENRKADKKNQTMRVDEFYLNYTINKGRGRSFTDGYKAVCDGLIALEACGLADLHGYFTQNEWLYMANVLKISDMIVDKNVLMLKVADIKAINAYSGLYNVDVNALTTKISTLSLLNVFALVERINAYWVSDGIELKDWANF